MIIETNNHSKVNSDSKHSTSLCADESNPIEVIRLSAQTFTDDLVEPNPLDTRPSILVSPPPTPTSPISSSSSSSTTTTTTTTKIVNDLSVVVAGENLDLITTELHSKSDDHRLEQQQQQQKSDQADPSHHPVSSLDTTNTPLLHQNPSKLLNLIL
ncbi:hypothetical protein BLOT_015461 [Blomia tropicalis]|nr:hypothetical protein BLOT_015461 [Blomia tropicalis]